MTSVAIVTVPRTCIHSGICAGWGWGLASYTRNIQIENNSITKVMQLLSDGGGVCKHSTRIHSHAPIGAPLIY
eukprot:COSAG02_NODE_202_length_29305_cov_20.432377_5_plen_73_part_00